jgi:hypothetical protein
MIRNVMINFAVVKKSIAVSLILLGPVGCVTQDGIPAQRADGPAYMQPGVGAPARQTDMFGNAFRN